jgi:beta-lactamase regulating signal transducer with metallopeptidase domain/tetratricopeptide (TPR) repeat protein
MNSLIESLNVWGGRFVDFALPLLWQSSVLIAAVFAFDFFLRRRIRPAVRYTLWFVVFVKLLLPPTLALPTGAAWWLRMHDAPPVAPHARTLTVRYDAPVMPFVPRPGPRLAAYVPPPPTLSRDAWVLLGSLFVSALLAAWSVFRWRQIARCVARTTAATTEINKMLAEARRLAGLRKNVRLRLTAESMSPAVCGLFRPIVLLPQSLIERLTAIQLRAVLLHELIHLRRRDVWVNCAQTLLQIVYWWHPLLWFANARMRRVREEAVDDAVMFALSEEAEIYAPTLLEVAKLAFNRPLATLGLVGILESRNALRHRIERLLNFSAPRRVGVSVASVICIAAFTALAVPMGEPPARAPQTSELSDGDKLITFHGKVNPEIFIRNIQARAAGTMHTTNDDLTDILASILDGFGVDCAPPRNITFDAATGEVRMQNTPEALQIVDSVVRELNLPGGEHVLNPPYNLTQVLIEAQFYRMSAADFAKLNLDAGHSHHDRDLSPWWDLSAAEFSAVQERLKTPGFDRISAPRVLTAQGVMASLFVGDQTNNIQLECVPSIRDGLVNVTTLARTTGKYAPEGGWPDFAGHTNCAIFSRVGIPEGDGVVLRAEYLSTMPDNELIVLLTAKKVPFLTDLPRIGRLFRSQSNEATNLYTFTFQLDPKALAQRLDKFAAEHSMEGTTNQVALLGKLLQNAGINIQSSRSYFYKENGELTLQATKDELRKAAEALGLNWNDEQSLNQGKTNQLSALGGTKANSSTSSSGSQGPRSDILVDLQDGKLLFQAGKLNEAEGKLQKILAVDPNNQAALYYMSLIKEARVRGTVDAQFKAKLPAPNPYARTNIIHTSPERQRIYEKLNKITFGNIAYNNASLADVVLDLTAKTQIRDPEKTGINFLLNRSRPPVGSDGQPLVFDPTTGQPMATSRANTNDDVDLSTVSIYLEPGLKNVRLLDVLEAITKSADHPIKYSLLDYGIEFSLKGQDQLQLHTRTFKLDPNTFYTGLQSVSTLNFGSATNGFNGSKQIPPAKVPATVATNAAGTGTNRGLRYVAGLGTSTDFQLTIINFFNSIGVNLAAPKSVFYNERQGTLTVHATDDDLELIEAAINTLNQPAPEVTIKVRFVEADETFLPEVLTNIMSGPANTPLTSILTEPMFHRVLKALEKRDHATLMSEGEVTTLSGRQANFQVVDVQTIVNGVTATVTNNATTYTYQTSTEPFGPTLDVVPYVGADGYNIQMTVTPSVTEFLGYEDPKALAHYYPNFKGTKLPLPKTRVRQIKTSATVWDGQTLVLGNLTDELVVSGPNGATSRQPFTGDKKKQLLIFITPTIIDTAGNRIRPQGDAPVLQ